MSFDAEATDRLDTREATLAPRVCYAHYVCISSGVGEQRLEAEVFVVVDEDIDPTFHVGLRFRRLIQPRVRQLVVQVVIECDESLISASIDVVNDTE